MPSYESLMAVPFPEGWRQRARCAQPGVNPDAWYPLVYALSGRDTADVRAVRQACHACPVMLECLAKSVREEGASSAAFRYGMKGGARPDERAAAYRKPAQAAAEARLADQCDYPRPGSAGAVQRHVRMKTTLCRACRAYKTAQREASRVA
jgi:hypothetical protein